MKSCTRMTAQIARKTYQIEKEIFLFIGIPTRMWRFRVSRCDHPPGPPFMRAEEPSGVSHDLDRAIPADRAMGGAQEDLLVKGYQPWRWSALASG